MTQINRFKITQFIDEQYLVACSKLTAKTRRGHRIAGRKITHNEALEILRDFKEKIHSKVKEIEPLLSKE